MPGRRRNQNALGPGLYSRNPLVRVEVPADVTTAEMAKMADDLAAAATWIAEKLASAVADDLVHQGQRLVGLYASVAHELLQVGAELRGQSGIKPSPLGDLTMGQYETLMGQQAKNLGLILSQCASVWKHLQDRELVLGASVVEMIPVPGGQVVVVGETNPVLDYLAAHMRSAKRIMRDMAANRAWREAGQARGDDLGERLMSIIGFHPESNETDEEAERV